MAGSIRAGWAGRLMIANVRSTGQDIRRTTKLIGDADNAYFQVALVAGGTGRLSQDDRDAELGPGDCAVYETTRPFQWQFDNAWDVWVFSLPADSVRLTEAQRRHLSACRLDGTRGLTGVVSRFLLDLARHGEDLPAEQSDQVLAHASDLVITLLGQHLEATDTVRGARHGSLMPRIKDYIQQHLHDPGLDPARIAAAVHISTRYLHKLFQAEHDTVALYVRGLRLDQARRDLLDPRHAQHSIAAIAHACGFGDLSGFNRAFKTAYGLSPTDLRTPTTTSDGGKRIPPPQEK